MAERARATKAGWAPPVTADAAPRADAVEDGDIDAVLTLLTSDAWLTMPPEPYE